MGCLLAFRWWGIVLFVGFGFTIVGWEETRLAWRCRSEPEALEVAELEKGYLPSNDYVTLGPHVGIMEGVYEQRVPKGQKPTPGRDGWVPINYFYYPIVSLQNPVATSSDVAHGSYAVLVKTHEHKTLGELDQWLGDGKPRRAEGLSGVIINVIDPLDKSERDLLHGSFPQLDLDHVLLLEQNRIPESRKGALSTLLFGVLLMLTPVVWWVLRSFNFSFGERAPAGVGYTPMSSAPSPSHPAPSAASGAPPTASTTLGYAPPSSYPPVSPAVTSGYGTPGSYGSSLPPPPTSQRPPGSVPPISARLQPGARVRVSRKTGDVFGTVVKAQAGQVSVHLDEGRTVWVSTDVISLA